MLTWLLLRDDHDLLSREQWKILNKIQSQPQLAYGPHEHKPAARIKQTRQQTTSCKDAPDCKLHQSVAHCYSAEDQTLLRQTGDEGNNYVHHKMYSIHLAQGMPRSEWLHSF